VTYFVVVPRYITLATRSCTTLDSTLLALLVTLLTAVHPYSDLLHTPTLQEAKLEMLSNLTTTSFAWQPHKAQSLNVGQSASHIVYQLVEGLRE
jgi:hypothetical protein